MSFPTSFSPLYSFPHLSFIISPPTFPTPTPPPPHPLRYGNEHDLWKEADSVTIDPTPGTLVMFYSRGLRHEVLATQVIRRAVVGWFRVRSRSVY